MSHIINIKENDTVLYDIYITNGFQELNVFLKPFLSEDKKVCIVTDSNVEKLYTEQIKSIVEDNGNKCVVFSFPAGEENKNLNTVQNLYEYLIKNRFERRDVLIALGGGVVGDLAGFTAATYLRGIKFIQIPTSLLAQTDSSVGGKTGVDFRGYKNMVGAFHQPSLVFMNMDVLKTLDERQFLAGLGEIIKTGFIKDAEFYNWIIDNAEKILSYDKDAINNIVYKSCLVKAGVVSRDPKESGERALLNFGHTLGHAIEKCADFKILHGECVVLGMMAALKISENRGMISSEDMNTAEKLFINLGYNMDVSYLDVNEIITATKSDKKMENGVVKFILLDGIGNGVIVKDVTDDEMREGLKTVMKNRG